MTSSAVGLLVGGGLSGGNPFTPATSSLIQRRNDRYMQYIETMKTISKSQANA